MSEIWGSQIRIPGRETHELWRSILLHRWYLGERLNRDVGNSHGVIILRISPRRLRLRERDAGLYSVNANRREYVCPARPPRCNAAHFTRLSLNSFPIGRLPKSWISALQNLGPLNYSRAFVYHSCGNRDFAWFSPPSIPR